MKNRALLLGLLGIAYTSMAQISEGGMPPSFSTEFTQLKSSTEVERIAIKAPNLTQLAVEDNDAASKGDMYRVATNIPVSYNTSNSGTWETLPNGDRLWRLTISSPDALALGLYYADQIWLPHGSKMYLYNKNHRQIIGAYTAEINNFENPIHANEMIQGEEVTIEYYAPKFVSKLPTINIESVAYFYRNVEDHVMHYMDEAEFEAMMKAQSCEVNVACSEANGWQDQVDAVVHYTFTDGGSTYVCSGSMIANTSGDCTPYLLTANHCGEKTASSDFNNNVWYFKYENPNCSAGTTSQYPKPSTTMTGAVFRASSMNGSHQATSNQVYGSDFTLVELNSQPPSSYQVFYAGWDRRNTAATSGKGIHHPAGHDKKISTYTSSVQSSTYNGGLSSAHWSVVWAATSNGHGVTEGGSSGSPLFNQNQRIIGDLSGGSSYCTTPTASDLYGKLAYSWDQLSSSANGQLKAWLDPINSGEQFIDGVRPPCSATPNPTPITCTSTISSFPYNEGFEGSTGAWTQSSNDDIDWTNQSGGTPSSSTGPTAADEGSYYMYIEASSPNYPSKTASLLSPCFNLGSLSSPVLAFSYNMYGAAMGTLNIDVSDDSGNTWNNGAWSLSGDQGTSWTQVQLDLSSYAGSTIMIRFRGVTGTNYTSDMCIDGFSIKETATTPPPTPSSCSSTITSFPYSESFEGSTGAWTQGSSDDIDWTNQSGSTPSSNTGATVANDGSYYMYIEASSPNYPSKSAQLISPCFDLSSLSSPELSFAYNMYGAAMGSLNIEASTDEGSTWSSLGSISGDQGTSWLNATVDLSTYAGSTVMFRFNGLTGDNYTSDICIDAFAIEETSVTPPTSTPTTCSSTVSSFPYNEGFEAGTGLWSQGSGDDLDWTNQSGSTPSSSTGPSGATEGSKYMYIEASSPNYPSKVAQLISPCFDLSGISGASFDFAYNMYGAAMGSLGVDISTDGGTTWTSNVWSISGDQGSVWKTASIDLSSYAGSTITVRFNGSTGSNYTSDICIDAVAISTGGGTTPPPTLTYCTPAPSNGTSDGDYVDGVSLGSISNTSSGGTGSASYKDYTSMSTDLSKGASATITIVEGGYAPDRYAAWIDYNQDGDFDDAGEKLGEVTGTTAGSTKQISFTVSSTALDGSTRMRVRCLYNGNANGVDPCVDGDYGETEDYTVNIVAGAKASTKDLLLDAGEIKVFPNPAIDKLNLEMTVQENSEVSIQLHSITGSVVYQHYEITEGTLFQKEMILDEVSAGTYLMVITVNGQQLTKKVVVR